MHACLNVSAQRRRMHQRVIDRMRISFAIEESKTLKTASTTLHLWMASVSSSSCWLSIVVASKCWTHNGLSHTSNTEGLQCRQSKTRIVKHRSRNPVQKTCHRYPFVGKCLFCIRVLLVYLSLDNACECIYVWMVLQNTGTYSISSIPCWWVTYLANCLWIICSHYYRLSCSDQCSRS